MTKQLYLGYNRYSHSIYLNYKGQSTTDNIDFQHKLALPTKENPDPSNCIPNLITHLENNYSGRKAHLISELPLRQSSLLETMIHRSKDLKKMSLEFPNLEQELSKFSNTI